MVRANNPLIALSSRPANLGDAFISGKQEARRSEIHELAKTDRTNAIARQEEIDAANAATAQAAAEEKAKMQNLKSIALGAVEVKPLLDNIETIPQATRKLEARIQEIEARNGDASDTREILDAIRAGRIDQARAGIESGLRAAEVHGFVKRDANGVPSAVPAGIQEIDHLIELSKSDDPDVASAARIKLGQDRRAGTVSAAESIANTPGQTDAVADSQATIAGAKTFAQKTEAERADSISAAGESIVTLDKNTRNLGKALRAIDDGAASGVIVNRFSPTVRAATLALEQAQAELGLDVVGATTFGALSEGELNLALTVAIPDGMKPSDLRKWIVDKQAANSKLRDYFEDQIDWLEDGGSVANFVRHKRELGGQATQSTSQSSEQQIDPSLLEFMTPAERALFGGQ